MGFEQKLSPDVLTLSRLLCLAGALLVYGTFGYPTPDRPGWVEICVAFGLVGAVTLPHAALSLRRTPAECRLWVLGAHYLFLYGISVPMVVALLSGNIPGMIIRDIFPFFFLLLPLFLFDLMERLSARHYRMIVGIILAAGLLFALRGILVMRMEPEGPANPDALYLVNAPTVLFAALLLIGIATERFSLKRPWPSLAIGALALLPMLAMGMVLQRASFGVIGITAALLWLMLLRRSLLQAVAALACVVAAMWLLQGPVEYIMGRLLEKHRAVGSNMRFLELQAVWDQVTTSPFTMFFGQGWGATVRSPAVGGLSVNYTHSLLSAALLKTGLMGLALTIFYLGALSLRFPRLFNVSPVLAFALIWPFIIDIFLYASYKSLDFGLILLLIATYAERREHKNIRTQPRLHEQQKPPHITDQPGLSAAEGRDGTAAS